MEEGLYKQKKKQKKNVMASSGHGRILLMSRRHLSLGWDHYQLTVGSLNIDGRLGSCLRLF